MADDIEASTIALITAQTEIDPATINDQTELADLQIDSLVLTEIVMEIEDKYDIEIDLNAAEAWESLKTVGDMTAMVKKLIAARA